MEAPPSSGGFSFESRTYDGRRMRKPVVRKTVDYAASITKYLQNRLYYTHLSEFPALQPTADYVKDLNAPMRLWENPSHAYCTKYITSSTNKIRCAINTVNWTPDARRLVTGASTGEFTLWNGLTFNFETILQAHETQIRSSAWSRSDTWFVSADDAGVIKYWQASMNNVKAFKGHNDCIRDLSFSPTDARLASAADDQTISIWDFENCREERTLRGHGYDVRCCQWHPHSSLLVSGSKDQLLKLWDPRVPQAFHTLHAHKNTVNRVAWNQNGVHFISGSRDQTIRIWDIRQMKEISSLRAHKREVTALAWHPHVESLFVSGSNDGDIRYWKVGLPDPVAEISNAHDKEVSSLSWHPMGQLLVSGSADNTTRWWGRNRPGDDMQDKYNVTQLPEEKKQEALMDLVEAARLNPSKVSARLPMPIEEYAQPEDFQHNAKDEVVPLMGARANQNSMPMRSAMPPQRPMDSRPPPREDFRKRPRDESPGRDRDYRDRDGDRDRDRDRDYRGPPSRGFDQRAPPPAGGYSQPPPAYGGGGGYSHPQQPPQPGYYPAGVAPPPGPHYPPPQPPHQQAPPPQQSYYPQGRGPPQGDRYRR